VKKLFFILFFIFCKISSDAQVLNLSSDPAIFIEDFSKQLEKHLGGPYSKNGLSSFSDLYKNKINDGGKKELMLLFQSLTRKGIKPLEIYTTSQFLFTYFNTGAIDAEGFATFVNYLRRTLEVQSSKKINEVIFQFDSFFRKNQLYTSNFNKVYALNGTCTFRFFDKKQDYFVPLETPKTPKPVENEEEDIGWGDNTKEEEEYDPWNDPNLEIKPNGISDEYQVAKLPQVEGIVAVFQSVSLAMVSPSDSIVIKNTSGGYDFVNGVFVGEKGQIDWIADTDPASARLEKYYFKSITGRFFSDNVQFEHQDHLMGTIKGLLEIKLEKRNIGKKSSYPRFKSYKNDAKIKINYPYYNYSGGYSLVGSVVSSQSLLEPFSKLIINKDQRNQFEVIGRNFYFIDTLIRSDKVSFMTKFGKDSVSHPAVKMEFDLKNNHLQLNKLEKGGFRNSMYSDTFHQVDIKSDAMSWDLSGGKMNFYIVAGKTEIEAVFESFDYYNPERIRALSAASGFNPLIAAGNIVARKKKNIITIDEMQAFTRKERFQVSNGMLIGNQMGFFDYDPYSNTYKLSRKGEHYFLVFNGKKDFDDLVLTSLSSGGKTAGNASIDLESKSLDIRGAQDFKLSDSLGISFVPTDKSMKVVGNKIFSFEGKIIVKNFKFFGDFEVEYEKFLVKLKRIDSITFIPLEIYKNGGKTEIGGHFKYGTTGVLYLNSPTNKSGRKNLAEFPKLDIPGGVLVYFNEKGRKQKFGKEVFFKASAISIDSLNGINPAFAGVWQSGGIFKPINENLVVMPDTSMGIFHRARLPYQLYGTESQIKPSTEITLNRAGIKSAGEISHLAGKLQLKDVKFYADRVTGNGESGKIIETSASGGVFFPEVTINEFNMFWSPADDSMAVSSEKGFSFYNGTSTLKGAIVLKKPGLFGDGKLDRSDSDTQSKHFKFNRSGFLAENSTFNIKSIDNPEKPIFSGKHVGIDFSVQKNIVGIKSQNNDLDGNLNSTLEFPYSAYSTTIDNATWNIKDKKITMQGALESSLFTATTPNQYGLKYYGTGALYDIANTSLNITGVQEIHSADAAILPPDGKVFVKKDGTLESFTKAKIITDTLNRYHTLTNASVKINSRLSFAGNADYQYVNVSSDTFNIKLGNFEFAELTADGQMLSTKSSGKLSTIARAKITEKDSVFLSPRMLYKGEITMLAPFKNLAMNGQVLPDLKKYPMFGGSWINYKGNKSEAISINVDETLRDGGKPLWVGLHIKDGAMMDALYPTFLSTKISGDDLDMFLATGVFKRDEPNKKFVVSAADENQIANRYEFYDDKGIIALEGKFNLLGAPTKIFETVGIANIFMDSLKYQFATMMKLDFPLSIPNTQKLGQNIVKANLDAGNSDAAIVPDSPVFQSKLNQYVGRKEVDTYLSKSAREHLPLFKFSNKFLSTMVISDLNLRWNRVTNAYYSVGKIGISNIGDVDINAKTNGYVEIVKSPQTGDEIHIMIEISPTSWYYFTYKSGTLGVTSSDEDINKLLAGPVGGKEKKSDVEFLDLAQAQKFKKQFLQKYRGIKEEEVVKKPVSSKEDPTTPAKKAPVKKTEEKEGF